MFTIFNNLVAQKQVKSIIMIIMPTFKNEVRKFCRKRLAVKQCFALAQSNEKHTAGLP